MFSIPAAGIGILLLLSRREPVPACGSTGEEGSALRRPFSRAAWYLWRKVHPGRRADRVREDTVLSADAVKVQRVEIMLLFTLAAAILGLTVTAAENGKSLIRDGRYIERNSYGGAAKEVTARAVAPELPDSSGEINYGSYEIPVDARQYTPEELGMLAEEVKALLPGLVAGENPDLDHVSQALQLAARIEGYPFTVSWSSEDYELIGSDGTVHTEILKEGESRRTAVRARLTCNGCQFEYVFPVTVCREEDTGEEKLRRHIQAALEEENRTQAASSRLELPAEVDGHRIVWEEEKKNTAVLLFFLTLGAGAVDLVLAGHKQRQQIEARRRSLQLSYPRLVSRMTLYLGAGMSVRNVFYRLGEEYEEESGKGKKIAAGEEILKACRLLDAGTSETTAYTLFGQRCGLRSYQRLASLLTQNLRKGNRELLQMLRQEAAEAEEERRQMAKRLGEEAGTKLLVPMVMMLAVAMVMIILPAFLGFA